MNSFTVNEASDFAVFTVSGREGQQVQLELVAGTASSGSDHGTALQYWDGDSWENYSTGQWVGVPADTDGANGETANLLVRVALVDDGLADQGETFSLKASNTGGSSAAGTATIMDDGTGTLFATTAASSTDGVTAATGSSAATPQTLTPTTGAVLSPTATLLDDDRAVSVNDITVNEGSGHAVFAVTGAAGQSVSLALGNTAATTDTDATLGTDAGTALQYFDGSAWQDYTAGDLVQIPAGGTLPVRTAITNDTNSEGAETFTLTATNTGGGSDAGLATIADDGTGTKWSFAGTSDPGTASTGPGAGFDDDRPVTLTSPTVNEASPYVVFTVDGALGQQVSLALGTGTATSSDYTASMEVSADGGLTWSSYSSGLVALNGTGGTLLVRVPVLADATDEPAETFTLTATPTGTANIAVTGTASIVDDGNGDVFKADGTVDANATKDDDRAITVQGGTYNEASPRAVFTVAASANQWLTLGVTDAAAAGGVATTGLDLAPIFYSVDGGASWQAYTGAFQAGAQPVLVAVDIGAERDATNEGFEQFRLQVNPGQSSAASAYAVISDDGTGAITAEITSASVGIFHPAEDLGGLKDDDRPRAALQPVVLRQTSPEIPAAVPVLPSSVHVQVAVAQARQSSSMAADVQLFSTGLMGASMLGNQRMDALVEQYDRPLDPNLFVLTAVREVRSQGLEVKMPTLTLQSGLLIDPKPALLQLSRVFKGLADQTLAELAHDDVSKQTAQAFVRVLESQEFAFKEQRSDKGLKSFSRQLREAAKSRVPS